MCEDAYFQLRMSKKQLDRLSKKAEKEQKQQEAKVGGKTFILTHSQKVVDTPLHHKMKYHFILNSFS